MGALSLQAQLQTLLLVFVIFLPDVNSFCQPSIRCDQNVFHRQSRQGSLQKLVTRQPGISMRRPKTQVQSSLVATSLASSFASTTITALESFWRACPYAAAAVTCALKASAADLIAQKRAFRKHELELAAEAKKAAAKQGRTKGSSRYVYNSNGIMKTKGNSRPDMRRNLAYLMYGAIYQGLTQEFIYNHIYPTWFGRGNGLVVVATKVLFDMFVQTTVLTLPIAYLTKAVIFGQTLKQGIALYIDDIKNNHLLTKYFMLWTPVQCITFSIVPEHFRVSFVACVSFFWLIILSSITTKDVQPSAKKAEVDIKSETPVEVDMVG